LEPQKWHQLNEGDEVKLGPVRFKFIRGGLIQLDPALRSTR
jgi:hypothetical protein